MLPPVLSSDKDPRFVKLPFPFLVNWSTLLSRLSGCQHPFSFSAPLRLSFELGTVEVAHSFVPSFAARVFPHLSGLQAPTEAIVSFFSHPMRSD